ncbi:gelsolin-like protein 2 [Tubulanus polymorphus]|uniref:gelsolin-like protein 2 n=1 Tax=Tubulanus polymorphus TaxID=672921 RepID=UPI003DA5BA0E
MSGLVKAKKYDWKDSNMALFGSDIDKGVKKESALTEKAWISVTNLSKGQQALFVWRIEKFKVVPWTLEDYGSFFSGDSYIVFSQRKNPENPDDMLQDVHFWIGQKSSQDEYGTAAYKTVELDTLLDDKPVQHREVQGYESNLFKSYFDSITIMKGGCDSGFRHVTPEKYKTRLFHFSGTGKKITVKEVSLDQKSLTPNDVFLLDQGLTIIQWNGKACNKDEKFKAVQYLQKLKSGRHGKCSSECLDDGDDDDSDEAKSFYSALNGTGGNDDDDDDDDDQTDQVDGSNAEKKLFRLSDKNGQMEFEHVTSGSVTKRDFKSNDVFIFDTGSEVFVWVGKGASPAEKKNGLSYAHWYLQNNSNPFKPVTVVNEGRESLEFRENLF